jgi:hypothetical protein
MIEVYNLCGEQKLRRFFVGLTPNPSPKEMGFDSLRPPD